MDTVNEAFTEARKKGLKLVIRFLYIGYGGIGSTSSNPEPDAPIEWVNKHANQLKPLLQNNKDVIAAVQTGFVGYWGEWHSSKYLHPLDKRKAVIDAVLDMTPKDRMTQLRYPMFKQFSYGGPLTDSQAYNQTPIARIGHHNDAFLRDANDGGTFKSSMQGQKTTNYCGSYPGGENPCWRDYLGKDTRFVPVGGEAGTQSSTPSQFADCSNALLQLSNMHWSFIHDGYSKVTLDHWVKQGCMPEIRRRLGYRFVLSKLNVSRQVAPGERMTFKLELRNEGFAAPFNPRPAVLVLKEKKTGHQREIPLTSVDPRRWLPGQAINVDAQVTIPGNLPQGTYNLYLWLPDAAQSLRTKPEYAIRLANQNVWQSGTRLNLLFNNLIVSGSPVPTLTPPPTTSTPTPTSKQTPTPTPEGPTPTTPPIPTNAFRGKYYNGQNFNTLKHSRIDDAIDFDWGLGSPAPGVGVDSFSVRWEGDWNFSQAGTYRFTSENDDGIRVWVDGQRIIDDWNSHPVKINTADVNLSAGTHRIKVEFFEDHSAVIARLSWALTTSNLPGDLDGDNDVDIFDYNTLVSNFGNTNCGNKADIDTDCDVDIFDYNLLVGNFGLTVVVN